jgi:hypothetical protein
VLSRQDVAFIGAGANERERRRVGRVRQFAAPTHMGDLFGRLRRAQAGHDERGVGQAGNAVEGGLELAAIGVDEPIALELHPERLALESEVARESPEFEGRVGLGRVLPDADVIEGRGMLRLAQIGRAGEERHAPIRCEHERLEEAEAERVVAGEPVHRLLLEQQQPVEPRLRHAARSAVLRRSNSSGEK